MPYARKIKVLSVIGTRPEAIKMSPVVRELERHGSVIESRVCVTAQHRQMLDQVLSLFGITPDYDLNVMQKSQTLAEVAACVLRKLEPVLLEARPDWVLVQGDTTTVAAAALAAFYAGAKVGHVEAGLRTFDKLQPFPEEVHRRVAAVIADLHFAATATSRDNLLREGVPEHHVFVTGNPVIDALHLASAAPYRPESGPLRAVDWSRRIVLVTAHRRENFGAPLVEICEGLRCIAHEYAEQLQIVYPVHPNPNVREPVHRLLGGIGNVSLIEPLDYLPLVYLMKHSTLVLTDSGGIQEEAPGLGKPVLVLRDVTERPEAVAAGTVRIVGPHRDRIVAETKRLLEDRAAYLEMARAVNPYGDGHSAERIVEALCRR